MKYNIALCFLLLSVLVSCSRSAGPPVMQVPQRPPAEPDISLEHTHFATEDSLYLLLLLEDRNRVVQVQKIVSAITYEVRSGKEVRNALVLKDTLQLGSHRIIDKDGGLYTSIALPKDAVSVANVVQVQLWEEAGKNIKLGPLFRIPLEADMMKKQHMLVYANTNRPVIRGYVTTSDQLKVISAGDTSNLAVGFVKADFAPALPPMSLRAEQHSRTLDITDTLTVSTGEPVQFEQEGLYLLWAGEPYAKGLLVQPWSFPDVTMSRELIGPLIYLTTSQEREKLHNAEDTKKAVDAFWQEAGGNSQTARELIRTFYGRVEVANKLFTSHKAGWATDRGMIHIIFGRPDKLSRGGAEETWIYGQTRIRPYIKFVFTKKQNNFTGNHYELVRLRDYQEVWYSTVAKWRAGITEM